MLSKCPPTSTFDPAQEREKPLEMPLKTREEAYLGNQIRKVRPTHTPAPSTGRPKRGERQVGQKIGYRVEGRKNPKAHMKL